VRFRALAVSGLLLSAAAQVFSADRPWVEVRSPGFTVLAKGDEKTARRMAWQFEQIRSAMQRQWSWARTTPGKPILVLVARDEGELKQLLPAYWERKGAARPAGIFVEGPDRYYVALNASARGPDMDTLNPYLGVYHEYMHLLLSLNFEEVPLWFDEGLAEYFGNTVIRDKDILRGAIIPWHVMQLRESRLLSLSELAGVDHASPYYNDNDKTGVFYAESWALVHYLLLGDDGAHASQLNRYASRLRAGRDPKQAFAAAFDDPDAIEKGLGRYVHQVAFKYQKVGIDVDVKAEDFTSRPLPADEVDAARASLHVLLRRADDARALVDSGLRGTPSSPSLHVAQGLLAEVENRPQDAAAAYRRAAELGSDSAYAYVRAAELGQQGGGSGEALPETVRLLRRAVELGPGNARAWLDLADALNHAGQLDEALAAARTAVDREPSNAWARLVLARVLWQEASSEDALREARFAFTLARDDNARKQAHSLLQTLEREPLPDVTTATAAALEKQCEKARAEACTTLAGRLQQGAGVEKDPARAAVFLERGCLAGDVHGCARLGHQLVTPGPGQDVVRAHPILDKGCSLSSAWCCAALGQLVEKGEGTSADPQRAAELYRRACDAGNGWSCGALANLHYAGNGVARDHRIAAGLYQRSCDAGERYGCLTLAVMQARGDGVPANVAQAMLSLRTLCDTGQAAACTELALLYVARQTRQDNSKARELLERACKAAEPRACQLAQSVPR